MASSGNPPRTFGAMLAFIGLALSVGGITLMEQSNSAYFLWIGLGILASGIFISIGKIVGAWLYLGTFLVIVVWSVLETGFNLETLLPRILLPAVLCVYVFSARILARLS